MTITFIQSNNHLFSMTSKLISAGTSYKQDNIHLFMKRVPIDVMINHIIPYLYKPQRKQLLYEIQIFNKQKRNGH